MKKTHFKIGLLTACLVSVSSVASAQSCGAESCDSGNCKCSKKHCDDTGLLEVINSAASNFEARLASMIPDRERQCERSQPKCSCVKCAESISSRPAPHKSVPHTEPRITPPVAQLDGDFVSPPAPRMKTPPNPIVDPVPAPKPNTHEVVPLPESRDNPFKDDPTTRNLRPVPARPANYLRSNNRVGAEYDPQASNQPMKSVLVPKVAAKTISDSSDRLATTTSTRRVQTQSSDASSQAEKSLFEQMSPEVVPASLSVPMSNLRKLPTIPPPSDQFINPLRAH